MSKGIKIQFTGASCVGKTTLINALAGMYPQFKIQKESVRYLKNKYGLDFRSGDAGLQLSILELQTRHAVNEENMFMDRGPVDSIAYTEYYRECGQSDMPVNIYQFVLDESARTAKENIDLIIFLRPNDFPVVEDGTRITDSSYRKRTDEIMEEIIHKWGLEDKVIEPHGTVSERIEFCKPYIDKLLEERT